MITTKEKAIKAYNLLSELRGLCYADDLDDFDALHDNIYWQLIGLNESMCEAEEDNFSDDWTKEFEDALKLANDIKDYREQLLKLSSKDFNWIYA